MPIKGPRYDFENAIITGLAKGFARHGQVGSDERLYGEGLWDTLSLNGIDPARLVSSPEGFRKFQELRALVTAKVIELKEVDHKV